MMSKNKTVTYIGISKQEQNLENNNLDILFYQSIIESK
jgi:hypothetical protein